MRMTEATRATVPARAGGWRILLVEDDFDSADALSRLLALHGHHVQIARSLGEARELLPERIDVLLCDLGLPDGSGLELLRDRGAAARPIAAIALTGRTTREDVARTQAAGFLDHVVKPVEFPKLLAAIERALVRVTPREGAPAAAGVIPAGSSR